MEEDRLRYILSDTQKITYAVSTYSLQSVQNFKTKHLANWSYALPNASRNEKTKAYRGLLKTLLPTTIQIRVALCAQHCFSETYLLGRDN